MTQLPTPAQAVEWLINNNHSLPHGIQTIRTTQSNLMAVSPDHPTYAARTEAADRALASVQAEQRRQQAIQAGIDPTFANSACDCVPGEPCCLRAFEVSDPKDASRKIVWPVADGKPSVLYLIAKDPYEGNPGAKAKVKLTDYEPCKNGRPDTPGMQASGFIEDPGRFQPNLERDLIVNIPFELPAVLSAFLPRELLITIYIVGYYTLASAYRDTVRPSLKPLQCMMDPASRGDLWVSPLLHLNLTAEVTGTVAVIFYMSSIPTIENRLDATITGEVGNQTLSLGRSYTNTVASASHGRRQGPQVRNPVLNVLAKIFESMQSLSREGSPGAAPPAGVSPPIRSSLRVENTYTLTAPKLQLKAKKGSPDLEYTLDPVSLRIGIVVTGEVDLLDLLLDRVPMMSGMLRDARQVAGDERNPVYASIVCKLVASAGGWIEFGVDNSAVITIGSASGWEAEFDRLHARFQGEVKITGKVTASGTAGVNTWIFTGAAGAEGTVSTGWHFGGRTREDASKKRIQETLYHFEGLVVKGRYFVQTGGTDQAEERNGFQTGSRETVGTTRVTRTAASVTRLIDREFTAMLIEKEGSPDDWKAVG